MYIGEQINVSMRKNSSSIKDNCMARNNIVRYILIYKMCNINTGQTLIKVKVFVKNMIEYEESHIMNIQHFIMSWSSERDLTCLITLFLFFIRITPSNDQHPLINLFFSACLASYRTLALLAARSSLT